MSGSIRQRSDNTWELRVYLGTDPVTHRRRYASRSVRGSRAEAKAELEVLAEVVAYPRRRYQETTLAELFEAWFDHASPGWSLNTRIQHRSVLDTHLIPRFGHLPVGKLTTADIDAFYGELLRRGLKDGSPMAAGSIFRIHGVLRRALNQAVRWDWVWTNPAENAAPPRYVQREIYSPPPKAIARLFEATRADPRLYALFRLAVITGARRGQLCGLQWRDIDFDRATVSFCRAIAQSPDGGSTIVPTKNRRRNKVDVDEETVKALLRYRQWAEELAEGADIEHGYNAFVFSKRPDMSKPWDPGTPTHIYRKIRDKVGLTGYRFHDLRHFMATEMLAAGVPIPTVSARLAHARASTTLNVYAHAVPGSDREAAEGLARLLRESIKG